MAMMMMRWWYDAIRTSAILTKPWWSLLPCFAFRWLYLSPTKGYWDRLFSVFSTRFGRVARRAPLAHSENIYVWPECMNATLLLSYELLLLIVFARWLSSSRLEVYHRTAAQHWIPYRTKCDAAGRVPYLYLLYCLILAFIPIYSCV